MNEIIYSLEDVSYIPMEIEKDVDDLLEWARSKHNYISEAELQKENEGKISIGMTADEVLERWGKPLDVNKTITEHGVSEQWVYPNYQYLYF
jgi:hypothetical protein